ncbi:hypothetical protein SCHPADRAFT_947773 [Schizopora paradoxa]|uniref:Uncharacterized protein n=1 Tax=Schizopora paradoxa TaxID=27342 RepID=A0A0H2QZD1_9AGAM|nr:hypothetical protein SCHPADRAFT_947773 [Schizopora paradoxa]
MASSPDDLSPKADDSPLPVLPPFVNEKDLLKAHAVTSWGYECFDSLPRVFKRAPKDIVDLFGARVKEIKSTGASICRVQRELSRALIDSVEDLWRICLSPHPCRGGNFEYGSLDREAFHNAVRNGHIDSLRRTTSAFRKQYVDLSRGVSELFNDVASKMMETEPIIGGQFFLGDFAIVATTGALVLNAIDVILDVLDVHLVQLNLGNELKDDQMIGLMESVYENGLWFSLRPDVINEFCQDD